MNISWSPNGDSFLNVIRRNACVVVENFLLSLGQGNGGNNNSIQSLVCHFLEQLEQCLTRARSLPSSVESVTVEVSLLYNLMYASYVQRQCSTNHETIGSILESLASNVLWTLKRVKGLVSSEDEVTDESCLDETSMKQDVVTALASLFTFLEILDYKELRLCVGLLACMWSLISILENDHDCLSSAQLSSVADFPTVDASLIQVKHGFLRLMSYADLMKNLEARYAVEASELTSSQLLYSLSNLLLAMECLRFDGLTECEGYAAKVTHSNWRVYGAVLTARAMLKGKRYLEAIQLLHNALSGDGLLDTAMTFQLYRLLASSYSMQGLPHLSIEMLRRCLQLEPDSTSALYALTQQFQSLQDGKAEMECLRELVRASEEAQKTNPYASHPPLLEDLVRTAVASEEKLTYSQSLYLLASRSVNLANHEEASQTFLKLIQIYEKTDSKNSFDTPPTTTPSSDFTLHHPDLLTVCRSAAQSLLAVPQNKQCLQLCEKVLDAVASSSSSSTPEMFAAFDTHFLQFNSSITDSSSQMDVTADATPTFTQPVRRKRHLSSTDFDEDCGSVNENCDWKHEENVLLLLLCQAQCLVAEGNSKTAVKVLNKAFERLLECRHLGRGQRAFGGGSASLSHPFNPHPKRPRYCEGQSGENAHRDLSIPQEEEEAEREDEGWEGACAQVLLYLSDTMARCDNHKDALHFARMAAQLTPDVENVQYFLCRGHLALGHDAEGSRPWLMHRGLPHNMGSVRLKTAWQQHMEMIRSLPEETEAEDDRRLLGMVNKRWKLQLDLDCLKSLLDSRMNSLPGQRS